MSRKFKNINGKRETNKQRSILKQFSINLQKEKLQNKQYELLTRREFSVMYFRYYYAIEYILPIVKKLNISRTAVSELHDRKINVEEFPSESEVLYSVDPFSIRVTLFEKHGRQKFNLFSFSQFFYQLKFNCKLNISKEPVKLKNLDSMYKYRNELVINENS